MAEMANLSTFSPGYAAGSPLDRQTDALLARLAAKNASHLDPGQLRGVDADTRNENNKIDKAAAQFESILLGTWLGQAEQSFGTVPGGDGEDPDADAGKDQLQGIAIQSLAGALTASGGIGIAKMISAQLHKADLKKAAADPGPEPQSTPAFPASQAPRAMPSGGGPASLSLVSMRSAAALPPGLPPPRAAARAPGSGPGK